MLCEDADLSVVEPDNEKSSVAPDYECLEVKMSNVTIWREDVNKMPARDSSETVDELNDRGIAVGMLGRHYFNECFAEVCQLFMRAGYRGGQLQRVVNLAGDIAVYDSTEWTYDDALEWNAPLMSE